VISGSRLKANRRNPTSCRAVKQQCSSAPEAILKTTCFTTSCALAMSPGAAAMMAMIASRTRRNEKPVLEGGLAGAHAKAVGHGVELELGELVQRLIWCRLLRWMSRVST